MFFLLIEQKAALLLKQRPRSAGVNALIQQGKVRVLAVTGTRNVSPPRPTWPRSPNWAMPAPISPFSSFAPGKTADEIVERLNGEINKVE